MRPLSLTALLLLGLTLASPAVVAADTLNERVVQFARAHLGQQVGNGECWTLADQALRAAGAHRPGMRGYGTYVFGRRVAEESLRPGDVIQFEDVHLEHQGPLGARSWKDFPHHTAIVTAVRGNRVTLLHQNFGHKRTVQQTIIDLNDLRRGSLACYRPQPR